MALPWRLPLMQAPIGPAATPELVAAVSKSGGLGTLAASWTPLPVVAEQVRWLRSSSELPFCVNLVLAFEQRHRLLVALDEGTPIVSFSWGVDRDLIEIAQGAGAYVLVQVGELDSALAAVESGADALIVQGVEAGGHVQSTRGLFELLGDIKTHSRIPVVAAGGIADGSGSRAAMEAGADAVACGTVFLAAEEADVHPTYLTHLIEAGADDTAVTTVFDGGWPNAPHRVIRNNVVNDWEAAGRPGRGQRPGEGEQVASRGGQAVMCYDDAQPTRDTVGDVSRMALYAGTSVRGVQRCELAADIVSRLMQHC